MSKKDIGDSKVVVAAKFFENVWGRSSFVTVVVPFFIGLSALGNVFAQSFAMPRVKQELAKEGILPFPRFWASDWPFNAPSGAILLHWIFTSALILGSNTSDVYTFITNVFIYSGNWIKGMPSPGPHQLGITVLIPSLPVFLAIGLVYLNFATSERWADQRTTFRSSPLLTIFWLVSLLFVQAAPFIKNSFLVNVPFYVVPTLGTSLLVLGTLYWLIWAKLLPAFGYDIQHEIVQMPDGSERVKYKVSFGLLFLFSCFLLLLLTRCCRGSNPKRGRSRASGRASGNGLRGEAEKDAGLIILGISVYALCMIPW